MSEKPFIHGLFKDTLIKLLKNLLKSLGSDVIKSEEQLGNEELRRQFRAMEKAKTKWLKEITPKTQKLHNRGEEAYEVMKQLYFSIQQRDANWTKFTAYFLDEYRKEKKWKLS